ncbi:hypothetical protein [Roseofilum casamattae]|uniref:Uncharacterized protein n=1 Tax=Roseofilum casamattae BLCC-M143 TaxID=3022442 RepID=A0ABT7BT93_9CYAN|nr:hypothetical protein [Roseofilum casamattae]MDJ1182399.1 hypothetical protein [Roseofilum casamattae BLCC-M143]
MTQTADLTGLTPQQVRQITLMIDQFKTLNQQQEQLTKEQLSTFDPTPLFFASEVLQPFNRTMLYGNRA